MRNQVDWGNQLTESLWWVTWVFTVAALCCAATFWLLTRYTRWGRQFYRLSWSYFRPGQTLLSWRPVLTFALMLWISVLEVRVSVLVTYSTNGMFTALQHLDSREFIRYVEIFLVIAIVDIFRVMSFYFVTKIFVLHWRAALTERVLDDWIDGHAYYRGQLTKKPVDNPDQRIQEDVRTFVDESQKLAIGSAHAVLSIVSFSIILWQISGPLTVWGVEIPRATILLAYLYVLITTAIAVKIGRPFVRLNFLKERFEASFRYGLVRMRDNGENIAFYRGVQVERAGLIGRFASVIHNAWALIYRGAKFEGFNFVVTKIANIFPILILAPRYFSGSVTLGDVQQASSALTNVHNSLSFFRITYQEFAAYRATLERLTGLLEVNAEARALPSVLTKDQPRGLTVRGLAVRRPDGQVLVDELSFDLDPGAALLVKGTSGSGKTSLLRSVAGLWPYAAGVVHRPAADRSLFLSQAPYLPFGTLRHSLAYPRSADVVPTEQAQEVLHEVFLAHLVDSLDVDDAWWRILSPGEQQRLGFARILINRPDMAFLDESSSSVDEGLEFALYQLIRTRLPECTLVSIGHRSTLDQLHSHHLTLLPGGRWNLTVPSY